MAKPTRHYGKWRYRWHDENGERQSGVHVDYEMADLLGQQNRLKTLEIRKGLRRPDPPDRTFKELAEYWLENYAREKRSLKDDASMLRRHLVPHFGGMLLPKIGAEDANIYKNSKPALHPKTVGNHLTLLIAMLNAAKELGWITSTPRIRKPKDGVKAFNYLRTRQDILKVLAAAREEGEITFTLYATAIFTGMRAGELAALRWEDIDFDQRLITVGRSFNGPTKSNEIRHVPILDALLPLLREWRLKWPGPVIFPTTKGTQHSPSARIFQETFQRVLRRAQVQAPTNRTSRKNALLFHDLRHTFASHWIINGGDLYRLQLILGHKSSKMTQRYAHLAPDAFASDYSRLGGSLPEGKVVKFIVDNSLALLDRESASAKSASPV